MRVPQAIPNWDDRRNRKLPFGRRRCEISSHRRWETHVERLAQILGELARNHGSGILDLLHPDVQLDCFGSLSEFEPMNQQFNSYHGESGVKRCLEFGQRTLDACSQIEFNIAPPHAGDDLVLFPSHDPYVSRCGLACSTKSFNLVEFNRGRVFRIDQFHHYVPAQQRKTINAI
jgi:hypothetical protein